MKVYDVISSVQGDVYCGYSETIANETFDDLHGELGPNQEKAVPQSYELRRLAKAA
jgi:hypothetical protein